MNIFGLPKGTLLLISSTNRIPKYVSVVTEMTERSVNAMG